MSDAGRISGADAHLGDRAELYALGALDADERLAVEAHLTECAVCTRAVSAAESTVAALDAAFAPQSAPPERLALRIAASAQAVAPPAAARKPARHDVRRSANNGLRPYATAAALVLAAGAGYGALAERWSDARQAASDSAILATIATSHFNHTSFTAVDARAPVSKVLYARDGAWLYVVVDSPTCRCRVVARSASAERDLGRPAVRGETATLFVHDHSRPTSLELVDDANTVVARAALIYPHS